MSPKTIPSKIIYFRLISPAWKELERIAIAECRTISSIVRQAVKEYLERRSKSAS